MRRFLVLLVVAVIAAACSRGEAKSVIEAVDRFRKAPVEQQPELADALEKVPCSDDAVCAAKDACVKSASLTAKGFRKQREVEQVLAEVLDGSLAKTDPRATKAGLELDEADRLRKEGMDALPACDEKITALRVKSH
jgi:hypothetical protein